MSKNNHDEIDFIKLYFSSSIVIYVVFLIIAGLAIFLGERQRTFSDTYKASIYTIIISLTVVGIFYGIMSIFALIKFIRNKYGVIYIIVPSIVLGNWIIPTPSWFEIILNLIIVGLSSYILFTLKIK